ncbi:MAG: sugar phosphate isomerase/epimerase [Pirellulales bacterium]|nr:sugar phosphate isomerase/epimerase [Pirellulales bacterium]
MSDWPVGLSTGCFYKSSIFDCLEPIRNSGFGLIEICSFPEHLDYHNMEAVRSAKRRIDDLDLEPYSLHAPLADDIDITSLDGDSRRHARDELIHAADAAAALGVRYLVIHPGPEKGGFPEKERFERMENAADVLTDVSNACREHKLALVLENMLPHLFSGRVRELLWILGALDTIDVGICLDTGHAYLSGDLSTVVNKLSGHLWMMHATDNHGQRDDHLPPGEGEIEWKKLLYQLSGIGFNGAIILEVAGQEDHQAMLDGARQARRYLREISRHLELSS